MVSSGAPLRLQILGPLRIWRDGIELDAGPPQQAYLLAVLLARAGKPVSTSELIDLIWAEDVPASAVNILQKYVGALRRLMEPALPARGTGSYLQRRGNGYLFAADPGMLDVVTFRELVDTAKTDAAEQRPDAALDCYVQALGLWHGAAGDGLAYGSTAMAIFAGLDGEFFDACVAATELAVPREQSERVLPSLHRAARMAPLHETVQVSLVSALAAAGRQAEALSVFRTVRARLAEELGIDPGPALVAAHRRVLERTPAKEAAYEQPAAPTAGTPTVDRLVGRAEELAVVRHAVESALAGDRGLVLVEGEPGVGKTRLLEEAGVEAGRRGAVVVWGHCLEDTPSMWPWVQMVGAVLGGLPAPAREDWHAGELGRLVAPHGSGHSTPVLPDSGAQFRLFEQAVALVRQVSAQRPVVLFVDDLQWADAASLDLFSHLAARLPGGTAMIGALRDRAPVPGSELARMLAAASRLPRHRRIRLGPLGPAEVAELVRRETGQDPGPGVARSIHARTAGNPFFVRELSRLLADSGVLTETAAAGTAVPSTVRDVVRERVAELGEEASGVLQIAALIGRDVDLTLLAGVAGLDAQTCLDLLESWEGLGLLEPSPGDPYSFRFAHDLVRESVAATTPTRTARLHLLVADALERTATDDEAVAERLARHLWAAGPLADPARTAAALVRAGRCAAAKSALEAAARQLESAAQVARRAGLAELELSALSLSTEVGGTGVGYLGSMLELLERAEHLARGLGREREAADFLFSRCAAYSQSIQLDRAGRLARRLLEQGGASAEPVVRAYGQYAWGIHQWSVGNIGEAFRYLSRPDPTVLDHLPDGGEDPLRRDLRLLGPVMLALITALHGDVDAARALFDTIEATADDDPYVITVWAAFACTAAAVAGDPARVLHVAERGMAVDPESSLAYFGSYQLRLALCWARAVTGEDPVGAAAEAQRLISAALAGPPRSGLATWYGLLGEMWLAAGKLDEAAVALGRADSAIDTYGQRYAEGLLLLLRARLMRARGEPVATVRAVAERARTLSSEREAHLFARRAEELLAEVAEA